MQQNTRTRNVQQMQVSYLIMLLRTAVMELELCDNIKGSESLLLTMRVLQHREKSFQKVTSVHIPLSHNDKSSLTYT